ncbi:MAG TPA: phage holin family protein [Firmicutes bacterium]|uniref:Phage holin family protein n=1 Tax=candidate division TA06 bacterium TaxID=2250710 RepID=A0A660S5Q9_UNCT6|nr:MAG: phage holin family protein [candidate division TA06 bacterium]HFD04534.1 phage holin family protein [Bacillota bacterium]
MDRNSRNNLTSFLLNLVALLLVAHLFHGIIITNIFSLILAVLVIGFINTFVGPILLVLTLPINILTIGLFTFIVNGMLFALAAFVVPGFAITDFSTAVFGSVVYSIFSIILNALFNK